jgi:hydrogenase expression/formation protein HypC
MCLAIPGQIETLIESDSLSRHGNVSFGGIIRDVNLSLVPEAVIGDYVIVHVGVAISRLDEASARQTLEDIGNLLDSNPD